MKRFSRPESDPLEEAGPSKSERKRDAHAAQQLGEELVALKDAELAALALPETLHDAIVAARSIRSRGGGARQRQYIGKLMRDIDLAAVRAALNSRTEHSALEARRFHRLEDWRTRLIEEGDEALNALQRSHPALDAAQWRQRVAAAQAERRRAGTAGAASRDLFRALRALLSAADDEPG